MTETVLREGDVEHRFPSGWVASKHDEWPFHVNHMRSAFNGSKAVDLVAHEPNNTLWLIELKDYRAHPRTKTIDLVDEIAIKVRDSLAGLLLAAKWRADHARSDDAKKHVGADRLRVVLHLEQSAKHSKLFPHLYEPADLQQKLNSS